MMPPYFPLYKSFSFATSAYSCTLMYVHTYLNAQVVYFGMKGSTFNVVRSPILAEILTMELN